MKIHSILLFFTILLLFGCQESKNNKVDYSNIESEMDSIMFEDLSFDSSYISSAFLLDTLNTGKLIVKWIGIRPLNILYRTGTGIPQLGFEIAYKNNMITDTLLTVDYGEFKIVIEDGHFKSWKRISIS